MKQGNEYFVLQFLEKDNTSFIKHSEIFILVNCKTHSQLRDHLNQMDTFERKFKFKAILNGGFKIWLKRCTSLAEDDLEAIFRRIL